MEHAGREGVSLLVVPIAFVSEHSETLVELDHDELAASSDLLDPAISQRSIQFDLWVARFDALNVPAVNFGPGDPMLAHSRGEHVPIDAIADCEASMRAWLAG